MSTGSAGDARVRRPVVGAVVDQHAAELEILWRARGRLSTAGHVNLSRLERFDQRLAAHLDGCVVAGPEGSRRVSAMLAGSNAAVAFAAAVVALEVSDAVALGKVISAAEAARGWSSTLRSALGWVDRERLAGLGRELLTSEAPFRRALGLAACRLHGVDPGPALLAGLKDPSPLVRAEALRTAGTVGRRELVSALAAVQDDDPDCQFWAAWSAVLLGDRMAALDALTRTALAPGKYRGRAFRLALQATSPAGAHAVLQSLAGDPDQLRRLIHGSGVVGDPAYVPWLITHMADDQTARVAGEAFSLITGTDLAWLDLERKPPEDFESGPNDDPEDPDVSMDPDEGLPWPDPLRIQAWWERNAARFQPGERYFMGAAVTREHAITVLRNGYQRQRMLAAHYRCLLEPGTPLFNVSAPAWRQQAQLAAFPGSGAEPDATRPPDRH